MKVEYSEVLKDFKIERKNDAKNLKGQYYYIQMRTIDQVAGEYQNVRATGLTGTSLIELSLSGPNKNRLVDYLNETYNLNIEENEAYETLGGFIVYHNEEELIDKCKYYLSHPEARNIITLRAMERIAQEHTYEHRIRKMIFQLNQIGILKLDGKSFYFSSNRKLSNGYG